LTTKNEEEVRKRRGKSSSSRFNIYQKAVLVAGILTLFLAIGLSPGMAPILSAGVVGGTLLFLLLLKNLKPQKEETEKADPEETLPQVEEKAVEQPEPFIDSGEKEISSSQETIPSEIIELPQGPPDKDEAEGKLEEEVPEEKEIFKDPQVFPENGRWAEIQERIVLLEEKTINLEDMLMQMEEKVADIRENYLKSEPKIDLQTILANIEERSEKIA
jgi:type II secretory pathway component PulC